MKTSIIEPEAAAGAEGETLMAFAGGVENEEESLRLLNSAVQAAANGVVITDTQGTIQ